jgi:hypothetical protein
VKLLPAFLILCTVLDAAEPRWLQEGPRATFQFAKGEISTTGAGNQPNWLRSEAEYENFRLTFEYKLAQWAEAAVILRAPRAGRPMQSGLAIFLGHDFHENITSYVTGAVAGALPPLKRLPTGYGQWHTATIDLDGRRLRAVIDDNTVQDVDLDSDPQLRHRLRRGYIGFPDLGHAYTVRNLHIEERPSREKFLELFDGRTLNGWELRGEGSWSVREGAIMGANGHGILYAAPVLSDFEFTTLVRSRNRVNGGIFLRGSPDLKQHRGFEVQIYSPVDSVYPTGSIYARQRARVSADYEDRWFLLQVRVEGSRCAVRLDGETVAEYDKLSGRNLQPGRIGLQIHLENASVEFKDLRVRPLTTP